MKPKKKETSAAIPKQDLLIVRDTDGDGILDTADACPTVPGMARFIGCPDTDGDGIEDRLDHCPAVFGLARYNGCPAPDSDKDGINDEQDSCVNVPGLTRYRGCPIPDTDGDGVNDEQDSCITIPGVKENKGCPMIDSLIKEKINLAARNIFFRTGSYELLPKSNDALDEVVNILKQNPALTLSIEGHTDNKGTEASNQVLSEKRANAVLRYFVSHGIADSRLSAAGYGQSKPIRSNQTEQGRANNRRVELIPK